MNATFDVLVEKDLEYVDAAGQRLCLDFYRPDTGGPVPVVVYLHGGGFAVGDKSDHSSERLIPVATRGIAVASVNYRLGADGEYPKPIHDVKAAIRWLRANSSKLGLNGDRIGIWGASAGGYLAAKTALTAGDAGLEGTLGEHLDQSSAVQAVVEWFATADFDSEFRRSDLETVLLPPSVMAGFLGEDKVRSDSPERRRLLNDVDLLTNIPENAPPFLICHGDRDNIVSPRHSQAFQEALSKAGVPSTLMMLGHAGHEGAEFDAPANLALTAAFLLTHLSASEPEAAALSGRVGQVGSGHA